ncbi:MAG TPA: Hpt domain-containing protein, partial [Nitrospirota bacterium]
MSDNQQEQFDDSSENIVKELRATFREEAYELLAELENSLLELEKDPENQEQIGRAFRAMHTIKGSGGACEFQEVSSFTHQLETIFDKIRSGRLKANKAIINLALQARDQIKDMFNSYYRGGSVDAAKTAELLARFKELTAGMAEQKTKITRSSKPAKSSEARLVTRTYRIRFRPSADALVQGADPVGILNELRALGTCLVVAQTEAIPFLEDYDPQANYTYWDVILTTNAGMNAIQDVFIFVKDSADVKIDVIDEEGSLEDETSYKRIGDILLERGDLSPEDLETVLKDKKMVGELLIENGAVPNATVESALVEQQHVRALREQRRGAEAASSIRVATGKLDTLVNLVG